MEKLIRILIAAAGRTFGARAMYELRKRPLAVKVLRRLYNRYPDGSVVEIVQGRAKGLKWRRWHAYDNSLWMGVYEPLMQEAIAGRLGPGSVYYDVGANIGFFTVMAARIVGPQGMVASFEPMPRVAEVLADQVRLNGFENVTIVRAAAGDREGSANFQPGRLPSTSKLSEDPGPDGIEVKVLRLDAFAKERPPDLIKVDVEGAEARVVEGALGLIQSDRPPTWIFEIHGEGPGQEVRQLLEPRGYRFYSLEGREILGSLNEHHHIVACSTTGKKAAGPAANPLNPQLPG